MDPNYLEFEQPIAELQAKIDELRKRVELGMPLWHKSDRTDYSGLTGAVRPRE